MGFGDELVFIGSGFGLVLVILMLLWFLSAAIGKIVAHLIPHPTAVPSAGSAPPSMLPPVTAGIPPHHLAAISTAVAVMTEGRGRVVSVRVPAHRAVAWAQEGRMDHFSSHRVRSDWTIPGPPHVAHEPAERS